MRLGLIVALGLLAGSCDKIPASDGYVFERREVDMPVVSVTKVEHPDTESLRREAERLGVEFGEGRDGFGFGFIYPATRRCEIHVVRPEAGWHPEEWGHELGHCFYGRWHG